MCNPAQHLDAWSFTVVLLSFIPGVGFLGAVGLVALAGTNGGSVWCRNILVVVTLVFTGATQQWLMALVLWLISVLIVLENVGLTRDRYQRKWKKSGQFRAVRQTENRWNPGTESGVRLSLDRPTTLQ